MQPNLRLPLRVLSRYPDLVVAVKRLLWGRRGEPISYGAHRLRYIPGTRPVRLMYADTANQVNRNDALQIRMFLTGVRPGDTVLDVGGHCGQYAVLLGTLVGPQGRVVTFEPNASARAALLQNLVLNGLENTVVVEQFALFERSGEHEFFSCGAASTSSLKRSGLAGSGNAHGVTRTVVRTETLDGFTSRCGLAPQWVKVDAEGAEINILRGAHKLLSGAATIVCELHPYMWHEFGTSFGELLALIKKHGRSMMYLDERLCVEDGPTYGSVVIRR